jgi:hypothetical protein
MVRSHIPKHIPDSKQQTANRIAFHPLGTQESGMWFGLHARLPTVNFRVLCQARIRLISRLLPSPESLLGHVRWNGFPKERRIPPPTPEKNKHNWAQQGLTNFSIHWYSGAKRFALQNGSIFEHKATRGFRLGHTHLQHYIYNRPLQHADWRLVLTTLRTSSSACISAATLANVQLLELCSHISFLPSHLEYVCVIPM